MSEPVYERANVADPIKAPTPCAGPNTSLGSALCTQCGLCCNGALHNFAKLDPDEVEYASGIGLTIRTVGRPGFALPCPMLKDSVCTIYGGRPKVCARYKCQLLQDLEAGSVTLEVAIGKVGTAKELVRRADELLPGEMTLPGARALIPASGPELPRSPAHMPLRLAITALSLYLDKHFAAAGTLPVGMAKKSSISARKRTGGACCIFAAGIACRDSSRAAFASCRQRCRARLPILCRTTRPRSPGTICALPASRRCCSRRSLGPISR